MALYNPHIASGLIETPSPAAQNDAPKAGVVLVVGTAGSGPATPVEFDNATRPYEVYGTEGTLARDIELAVLGADFGARVGGTRATPRVVGLRLKTGTPASADLFTDAAKTEKVMRVETSERSDRLWTISFSDKTVTVTNPVTGSQDRFLIDREGSGLTNAAAGPLGLAEQLRAAYGDALLIDVQTSRARWEVSLSDALAQGADPVVSSSRYETTLRLDRLSSADMAAYAPDGTQAYIADGQGRTDRYDFSAPDAKPVHNRAVPPALNKDARFYAVTAGKVVEAQQGFDTVRIEGLADAKRIGVGSTNTLLDVRTSGATDPSREFSLADLGTKDGGRVSEGYFRVRRFPIGQFDPAVEQAHLAPADAVARVATLSEVDVTAAHAQIEGVALSSGDRVLLLDQTEPSENGLYAVAADGTIAPVQGTLGWAVDVAAGPHQGARFVNGSGTFAEAAPVDVYAVEFDAPTGIADEAGELAAAYAADRAPDYTAEQVSVDRLGTPFHGVAPDVAAEVPDAAGFFQLEWQPLFGAAAPTVAPINLSGTGASSPLGTGIQTRVVWEGGRARVLLSKADLGAIYGSGEYDGRLDDAYLSVSYDSCVFGLTEKGRTEYLQSQNGLEYAVAGDLVTFSAPLPHNLVVRGLRVTQYRIGNDLVVLRRSGGNQVVVKGEGRQPGEAGGPVNNVEVVFGADYQYEPDFPAAGVSTQLMGGSAGANADVATTVKAIDSALSEFKDQPFKILVASGVYVDDAVEGYNTQTGLREAKNAGLLDVLAKHQARVSQNGAAGVVFAAVRPMAPASQSGRYTEDQVRRRFRELTQADAYDPLRPATILNGKSYASAFLFDAPFVAAVGGQPVVTDGAAFYAGVRSAMTNETALYQLEMPSSLQPLYRYDASDVHMPSVLAENRINTWTDRRGEVRLADERTGAGLIPDVKGRLVPSGFQSGLALHAANDFLQGAVAQLRGLLGPLPTTGVDTLKGSVVTILQGVANRTPGVKRLELNPDRDIVIRAIGGNALGMDIKLFVQVAGELRVISIKVGAVSETAATATSGTAGIPLAQ